MRKENNINKATHTKRQQFKHTRYLDKVSEVDVNGIEIYNKQIKKPSV